MSKPLRREGTVERGAVNTDTGRSSFTLCTCRRGAAEQWALAKPACVAR